MDASTPGPWRNLTDQSASENEIDLYVLSIYELVIWSILYSTIAVLAVFGNLLVIFVTVGRLRTRSVTTYFIINLALADLLTGVFAIPFKFQAALAQEWYLPDVLCKVVPYAETVTLSVSVFTLTASAVHEFRTVFAPKHGRLATNSASDWEKSVDLSSEVLLRKAMTMAGIELDSVGAEDSSETPTLGTRLLVLLIWILAIVLALPYGLFHDIHVFLIDPSLNSTISQCLPVYADEPWWKIYNIYIIIVTYFVPMFILDTAYILIAIKIWATTNTISEELQAVTDKNAVENGNRKKSCSHKSSRQLMKMLIIVVAVFSLCWFPLETYLLMNELKPEINGWFYINVLFFCSHWLAMSNSCLNPIIYGLYNDKYNREYKRVFVQLKRQLLGGKFETRSSSQNFSTEYPACTLIDKETSATHLTPQYIETFQVTGISTGKPTSL